MSLRSFLVAANHLHDCASWDVDGPGADEACTCELTRYQRVVDRMPETLVELLEATFELAEVEARGGDAATALARYQRLAGQTERIAMALPRWNRRSPP